MVKFKLYLDKDRETKWLNEMAARGYAMEGFFAGFYQFAKCTPGEYIYQVDINGGLFRVSEDYRSFMEEMGIEITALWGFWVILRKKAADGGFQLYTDRESKIENYMKIRKMFKIVTIIELILFYIEVFGAANGVAVGWAGIVVIGLLLIGCVRMALKTNQMIVELKNGDVMKSAQEKRKISGFMASGLLLNSCALVLQDSMSGYIVHVIQITAILLMLFGLFRMAHGSKE